MLFVVRCAVMFCVFYVFDLSVFLFVCVCFVCHVLCVVMVFVLHGFVCVLLMLYRFVLFVMFCV